MGYWIDGLLKDTKSWMAIGIFVLLGLSMAEILSAMFAEPFFNWWAVKITVVVMVGLGIYFAQKLYRREKKIRDIQKLLPPFERERRETLIKTLEENPEFLTHCYECQHYNQQISACSLHMFRRNKFIKPHLHAQVTYCLYWNAEIPQQLIADID